MFLKLMGAMPGYIYATEADSIYVNLFVESHASTVLNEQQVAIDQKTQYPWDGAVKILVNPSNPMVFNLMVRIPAWCRGATLKVNGESVSNVERVRGYARIERTWKKGDVVELLMPMPVEKVKAHPLVEADAGKAALMRGPLVYCIESADNSTAVRRLSLSSRSELSHDYRPDILHGATVISGSASLMNARAWGDTLYASARELPIARSVQFSAIPYYTNANRGPVQMIVWLPDAT
jgi:DUF1680 family protein